MNTQHGRETKSVIPIIRVYVTCKFDFADCTKLRKISGDISVISSKFKHISRAHIQSYTA